MSAIQRLKRRLEKTSALARLKASLSHDKKAVDLGGVLGSASISGLVGAIPMALIGAFQGRHGGRPQMLHDAAVGGIVGAVPAALFGGLQGYQEQKAREEAMRRYMRSGGYGSEFLSPPTEPK